MHSTTLVLIAAAVRADRLRPACALRRPSAAALTGKVTSAEEGAMEGVVVSAKKGIVTVSVVSDDKGEFSFPASKLDAGDYALTIRAVGYDLEGPKTVTVAAGKPASIDVKLAKTRNLAAQLTNLEWMLSVPGTDEQKRALTGCTNCHSVERILNSELQRRRVHERHQADGAIFQQQLLQEAADPRRGARHQPLRAERREGRGLFRQHQPQRRRAHLGAQDAAARRAAPAPR